MYKKLHTPEKEPSAEPFCDKGSFLGCVPERVFMLTKSECDIRTTLISKGYAPFRTILKGAYLKYKYN
jgi:hypothetical protein